MLATYKYHQLLFKNPSGTSRGVLRKKDSWFLILKDNGVTGIGECSVIYGLNPETKNIVEQKLLHLCDILNRNESPENSFFENCPSVLFAYEMAVLSLNNKAATLLFNCPFLRGEPIPINGLVWMGSKSFMYDQIKDKIEHGFKCIKIKIAAISFKEEITLIKYIRSQFTEDEIQIRVDANGGFENDDALEKLNVLSEFNLHSIEQPIKVNEYDKMAELCLNSPLSIALDEELIGVDVETQGKELLELIKPQYIILKPSLLGGFEKSRQWIEKANTLNISWWITSALESNIGLNAISQWTSTLESNMYQGLGTGQLYSNNIPSPLTINSGNLFYKGTWDLDLIIDK